MKGGWHRVLPCSHLDLVAPVVPLWEMHAWKDSLM